MGRNIFFIAAVWMMIGCSRSFDLGDKPPIEIPLADGTPTWSQGIGDVVKKKCANCHIHTSQRSRFVPSNTPSSINGISLESFFDNGTMAGLVYDRIFVTTATPMPPNFATPLTDHEKSKLKEWLETKTTPLSTYCGSSGSTTLSYSDIEPIVQQDCGSCHNGSNQVSLGSLTSLKQRRRISLSYLTSGVMPPSNSSYKNTDSGSKLVSWLCFSTEL